MKKLIGLLLISLYFSVNAQTSDIVIGPFAGYGRTSGIISATNNLKIPIKYYVPTALIPYMPGGAKFGQTPPYRCAMMLDGHGCGEKSINFGSYAAITTGDLPRLFNNGMPQYVQFSTSDYVNKKYAAPGTTDSFAYIYVFMQCYGGVTTNPCAGNTGLGVFLPIYSLNTIKWAKAFFKNVLDTTRIYDSGLSFGGGHVWLDLQDANVNIDIAAVVVSAGGVIDERNVQGGNTAQGVGSNWPAIDNWPGWILAIHATNDTQTQPNGASLTDWAIDSIINRKSKCNFTYIRRTTGDHMGSWTCWQDINNKNTPVTESNGQTFTFNPDIQSLLLRYTSSGRRP